MLVLGFSNRFVWRCPSERTLERYDRLAGPRHLDVGVGTGWFVDRCGWRGARPEITLLDLNENSLRAAAKRIRRYAPRTVRANALEPVDLGEERYDSIGLNYLLHCVPGAIEWKTSTIVGNLKPYLGEGGVVFGSTILGRGVDHNSLGRRLIALYNKKGIFANNEDDREGLERGLARELRNVETDVVGAVALFTARA